VYILIIEDKSEDHEENPEETTQEIEIDEKPKSEAHLFITKHEEPEINDPKQLTDITKYVVCIMIM